MLVFKLIVFIGMFLGITYGIEYLLPPFGHLYNTNPLVIISSLSKSVIFRTGVSSTLAILITVFLIGIIPLIIIIWLGKKFKDKRKKRLKNYKF